MPGWRPRRRRPRATAPPARRRGSGTGRRPRSGRSPGRGRRSSRSCAQGIARPRAAASDCAPILAAMADEQQFEQAIGAGYGFEGLSLTFGAAQHDDQTLPAAQVRVPLGMMNRHGLVAGATGTGKTKTLQVLAEQLSDAGVPVFISDIKGDISGLGAPAQTNDKITQRNAAIGYADYAPTAFPVEFLTLDRGGRGVRLRASVLSFGPILLSKVLQLN